MISATRMLCQKYTDLTDAEISYLESYGALLPALANAEQADVFIDCRTVTGLAHHPISGEPLKKSAQGTANALIVISQENGGLAHPGHTHTPVLPFYKKEHLEAHKNASRCSPRI